MYFEEGAIGQVFLKVLLKFNKDNESLTSSVVAERASWAPTKLINFVPQPTRGDMGGISKNFKHQLISLVELYIWLELCDSILNH